MDLFTHLLTCFLIYGFLGWLLMTIVHTVRTGRLVSAGFLCGPFCPSFGLTAAMLIRASSLLSTWPLSIFILCTLLALVLDVLGAWIMLGMFRIRWWAESPGGLRMITIRLLKAMVAGLLGSLLIYVVHPIIEPLISAISGNALRLCTTVGMGLFLLDSLYSLDVLDKLTLRLHRLHNEMERLGRPEDGKELPVDLARLRSLRVAGDLDDGTANTLAQVDTITTLWKPGYRLMMALPHMHPVGLAAETALLRQEWMGRSSDNEHWFCKALAHIKARLAGHEAKEDVPFAKGIGFYKLLWVFVVACVLGFLIETVFALVTRGVIENRTGMVYGPFNQVYGLGAVLMVVLLHPLAKMKDRWLFLGSALLGGAYEFVCSWVQELMFGTVSWDYTNNPTSIGGRTSLLLMLWWGVLGVVFMKGLYPRLSALIERIPRRPGVALSWMIAILLALNLFISAAAVGRWVGRQYEYPPQNAVDRFVDRNFPDKKMETIYPSMQMVTAPE